MSKYTDLAKKVNQEENLDSKIIKSEPILKVKLEAIISSQKAAVMVAQAELAEKEAEVDKALGYITTDAATWVKRVDAAKNSRDQAAEQLNAEELRRDELEEYLKLF